MSQDANEKELTTWGFTKGFRTGLITFILALQTSAIVYLYIDKGQVEKEKSQTEKEKFESQARLYEQMIEYLRPTKDRMENMVQKVDTVATIVLASANKVDSISNVKTIKKK
jgi:hypothetical protein